MGRFVLVFSTFFHILIYSTMSYADITNVDDGVFSATSDGGTAGVYDQIQITVSFGVVIDENFAPLFEDLSFTTADIGKTFTATESSDTDFSKAAEFLTNGTNEEVDVFGSLNGGVGSGTTESSALFGDSRIDFAGMSIESIDLRIDNLFFISPGADPNGDGMWTDFGYTTTVTVNAAPLPSGLFINIDIRPGNKLNTINPRSKGGIWVAVLSDTDSESPFDPLSQVDISTIEFGPDGATPIRHKVKDINKDGLGDLLLRFKIRRTGIACGDTEATLTGETFEGQSFTGTDSIKTVGCKHKKHHKKKHHKKHHDDDHKNVKGSSLN